MRTWIAEGRVGPDSLVWQEGWRDWQQAAEVFPPLGSGELESELGAMGASGGASTGAPTPGNDRPSRSRSVALNAAIITVLILAVVVLLGVFLWVLKGGPERQGDASTRAPTSVASAVHGPPAERPICGRIRAPRHVSPAARGLAVRAGALTAALLHGRAGR